MTFAICSKRCYRDSFSFALYERNDVINTHNSREKFNSFPDAFKWSSCQTSGILRFFPKRSHRKSDKSPPFKTRAGSASFYNSWPKFFSPIQRFYGSFVLNIRYLPYKLHNINVALHQLERSFIRMDPSPFLFIRMDLICMILTRTRNYLEFGIISGVK